MDRVEILIDRVIASLPTNIPYLNVLLQQTEGRYIFLGLLIVALLMIACLLAVILMKVFGYGRAEDEKTIPLGDVNDGVDLSDLKTQKGDKGFSFFKKGSEHPEFDMAEDPVLVEIEQEMLAVRQLYSDGHLIRDVYVSESKRLFEKAKLHRTE